VNNFFQTPDVIGQASFHRRGDAQRLVNPAEIIVHGVKGHHVFVVFDLLGKRIREPGKSAVGRANGQVLPFNVAGRNEIALRVSHDAFLEAEGLLHKSLPVPSIPFALFRWFNHAPSSPCQPGEKAITKFKVAHYPALTGLDQPGVLDDKGQVNLDHVRKRLHPDFSPFIIRLSDGRKIPIPHPDFIAVGKNVLVVLDAEDHSIKIDPLHIVSLDDARLKSTRR
jgi:hypothetical protein